MLQVIDRADGAHALKQDWRGDVQVSYNDWGHLVVRLIRSDGSDTLAVFDQMASRRIILFCQNALSPEKMQARQTALNDSADVPF